MVTQTFRSRPCLLGAALASLLGLFACAQVTTVSQGASPSQLATTFRCTVSEADLQQITPFAQRLDDTLANLREINERSEEKTKQLGLENPDVAEPLLEKARLLRSIGRREEARESLERALAIQRLELGDLNPRVATTRQILGNVFRDMGEAKLAMHMLFEAFTIYERTSQGQSAVAGNVLADLAWAHRGAGYTLSSQRLANRAWTILSGALPADDAGLVTILNLRGSLASGFRKFDDAVLLHGRALAIASANGERAYRGKVNALAGLAQALTGQGRHAQAIECQASALAMQRHAWGARAPEVTGSLVGMANASLAAGDLGTAKRRAEEALAIVDTPDPSGSRSSMWALRSLGKLYLALNDRITARRLYTRALHIREREIWFDRGVVAMLWLDLASTMNEPDELDEALSLNHRALTHFRSRVPDTWWIGVALNNLGAILSRQGRLVEARSRYEDALRHFQRALGPMDIEVAQTLTHLGSVVQELDGADKAVGYLHDALTIVAARGFVPQESWPTMHQYSKVLRNLHERAGAIYFAKQAVNAIQAMRGGAVDLDKSLQESFLADKAVAYRDLADLLIEEGRLPEALDALRLLKQEEYLDFTQRAAKKEIEESRLALTESERRVEDALQDGSSAAVQAALELDQLSRKARDDTPLSEGELARRKVLQDQLLVERHRFQKFLVELPKTLRMPIRELRAVSEGQLEGMRQMLRKRPGTAIVHYVMGPERLSIILTLPGVNLPFQTPVSDLALRTRIVAFREVLSSRNDPSAAAQGLFDVLVRPIEKALAEAGIDTLLLSLDGALRYLPFAALHDGQGYLVQRFSIGLLTESTKVQLGAATLASPLRVGGLGMTKGSKKFNMKPLPGVKSELYRIVSEGARQGLIPGVTFIDDAFTEARLQELVDRQYPILHIASHFQSQPGNEKDSFLLLGNEGTLTLEQIRRMDLSLDRVDLLTLSACETAVSEGRNAYGAELEGLGMMLLNQGARNVLATLWQVADQSTSELMFEFYRRQSESPHLPKTKVLRAAQLTLLGGGTASSGSGRARDFAHPFFWAPFVLMGSGQ